MWAQGLTIGVLIAAGVLTQAQRSQAHENRQVDHSWKNILEEQERENEHAEKEVKLHELAKVHPASA